LGDVEKLGNDEPKLASKMKNGKWGVFDVKYKP